MRKFLIFFILFVLSCTTETALKITENTDDKFSLEIPIFTKETVFEIEETGKLETLDTFEIEEGGFISSCKSNNDCNSGYCIETSEGNVCTRFCNNDCPEGWICKSIVNPNSDIVFICVPLFTYLCNPCSSNEDCYSPLTGSGNYCISYGEEGNFCGVNCENQKCPDGYICKEVAIKGELKKQCVASNNKCKCSKLASLYHLSTTCYNSNKYGICYGSRYCSQEELTQCDAEIPTKEVCDLKDNNCDGKIDNITEPETCFISNEFGTCYGFFECINGNKICNAPIPEEELCDGKDNDCNGVIDDNFNDNDKDGKADCIDEDDDNDGILDESDNCKFIKNTDQLDFDGDLIGDACDPDIDNDNVVNELDCEPYDPTISTFSPEICDGKDNDCDGLVDEDLCDDGNPCTKDICHSDSTCSYEFITGPCDDGNVCTLNDQCNNGICLGGIPLNCNDNNPCTKDLCHPTGGCYYENEKDGTSCEDGNYCTINDQCSKGTCMSGQWRNCEDGNPCTSNYCDPSKGCVSENMPNGTPCDDGDPCTVSDKCGGGICTPGSPYPCFIAGCIISVCVPIFGLPVCVCIN